MTRLVGAVKPSDKDRIAVLEAQLAAQTAQNTEFIRVINILIQRTDDLNERVTHFEDMDINGYENNEKVKFVR